MNNMTNTVTSVDFSQAGFEAFLASREEPAWVTDLRRTAFATFEELSWPSRRDEEWMRTDLRLFHLDRYGLRADAPSLDDAPPPYLSEGVELAGQASCVDSQQVEFDFKQEWADKGVLFGSLEAALQQHGEKLRPYFERAFDSTSDRFAALQGAFWSGGALLYVPRGVTVSTPFHSLTAITEGGSDLSRTLVILEDGAEATMLSETGSQTESGTGMHCGAIGLIVGPRAHLRYVNLQDWGHGVWHFAHQKALVDRDATLQWTIGALGAKVAKVNQHVELIGEGASAQVNGVMFTEGKQHLAYHTKQHHRVPSCRSDFLYKAALQDKSRTVWRGMIKVDPAAQKTDGYQRNDNLLLSSKARADSIPGLEIEADDVRCTHGSTSGRVDEELIFYAQCRGFTRKEAIRVIVTGFFQQVFDRITIDSVRESLAHAIARRVRDYE